MAKIEKKQTQGRTIAEFMAINWWVLWMAIGLMACYMYVVLSQISERYEAVLKKFNESSKGVIMLDYSGKTIYVEKTKLDGLNEGFKKAIANALRFYAVKDWYTLTGNYKNKVKTVEELEKANMQISEFKENFFSDSEPQGLSDFVAWEKTLLFLLNSDNLPEKILPSNVNIDTYKINNDETFDISITLEVIQNVYMIETDKWIDRSGQIEIKATGYFNPSKGTAINPLGIILSSFKPSYLKKR